MSQSDASPAPLGQRVLVPVANPASIQPLLRCAALLAAGDQGGVELLTVLAPDAPADERAYAWQGLADAESAAAELGVSTASQVLHAEDVASGVLDAVAERDASLVLMGWRGSSSTSDIFGRLIDRIVGRSTVPLAIVRHGTLPFRRVLLPVSADHLLPGGEGGLCLAARLAARLRVGADEPTTLLRTGPREVELPTSVAELGDRVHHDPRRTHHAVGAFAGADDLVVAPVAPTVSGLRAATTHLAWAAPEATLLVAVDVGPTRDGDLVDAVEDAGRPAPTPRRRDVQTVRIVLTVRLPDDGDVGPDELDAVLWAAGEVDHRMVWWPAGDPRMHVSATLTVRAATSNAAISRVMTRMHEAPELRGAEISYELDRGGPTHARRARQTEGAGAGSPGRGAGRR